MFSFSTSSPCIISTSFISPHASCFMFHAHAISSYPLFGSDVRSVLHCIAARSSFRWFLNILGFSFFFLRWRDALDIIIPSSAGRNLSPPLPFSSYSFYLYPSTILRQAHGPISISHSLDVAFFLFFFFTVMVTYLTYLLLLHYLQKNSVHFFAIFFN